MNKNIMKLSILLLACIFAVNGTPTTPVDYFVDNSDASPVTGDTSFALEFSLEPVSSMPVSEKVISEENSTDVPKDKKDVESPASTSTIKTEMPSTNTTKALSTSTSATTPKFISIKGQPDTHENEPEVKINRVSSANSGARFSASSFLSLFAILLVIFL